MLWPVKWPGTPADESKDWVLEEKGGCHLNRGKAGMDWILGDKVSLPRLLPGTAQREGLGGGALAPPLLCKNKYVK